MKNITFFFYAVFILLAVSCKKEDAGNPLIGEWKVTSRYISPGDEGTWTDVPGDFNEYIIFNKNGTMRGKEFGDYLYYRINADGTLTLSKSANEQDYSYKISHDTLIMSPTKPVICIEGCAVRLIKQ